jgi:hypothetical protein
MRKPGPFSVLSSIRKNFFDNFNRADTENDLGTAPDGRSWDAVRGIFRVFGFRAFSDSLPQSYPIASVTMPYQDATISADRIDNGSGIALWVTDSGNWWGIGLEEEEVDCNCSVATDCNRWNQGGLCDRWNVGNCNRWNAGNCRTFECTSWNANRCTSFSQLSQCRRWSVFFSTGGTFPREVCTGGWFRSCRS